MRSMCVGGGWEMGMRRDAGDCWCLLVFAGVCCSSCAMLAADSAVVLAVVGRAGVGVLAGGACLSARLRASAPTACRSTHWPPDLPSCYLPPNPLLPSAQAWAWSTVPHRPSACPSSPLPSFCAGLGLASSLLSFAVVEPLCTRLMFQVIIVACCFIVRVQLLVQGCWASFSFAVELFTCNCCGSVGSVACVKNHPPTTPPTLTTTLSPAALRPGERS